MDTLEQLRKETRQKTKGYFEKGILSVVAEDFFVFLKLNGQTVGGWTVDDRKEARTVIHAVINTIEVLGGNR